MGKIMLTVCAILLVGCATRASTALQDCRQMQAIEGIFDCLGEQRLRANTRRLMATLKRDWKAGKVSDEQVHRFMDGIAAIDREDTARDIGNLIGAVGGATSTYYGAKIEQQQQRQQQMLQTNQGYLSCTTYGSSISCTDARGGVMSCTRYANTVTCY